MSDMKSKIVSRLISGKPQTYEEFWDSLPDVVHSADIEKDYYDLFKKLNPHKKSKDKDYE